jgi:hypothetical protein
METEHEGVHDNAMEVSLIERKVSVIERCSAGSERDRKMLSSLLPPILWCSDSWNKIRAI